MVKRRNDKTPEPPGGRAAERLRMFLDARLPKADQRKSGKSRKRPKRAGPANQEGSK